MSSRRPLFLCLAWLTFLTAAVQLVLSEEVPILPRYVLPEDLLSFLFVAQLFFVLVLWPLYVRTPTQPAFLILALTVSAAPLVLLCARISGTAIGAVGRGEALIVVSACFVAALFSWGGGRVAPWYFLGLFVVAAGMPFLYYLLLEFSGTSIGFLAEVSPFRAVARTDSVAWIHSGTLGAAAVVAIVGRRRWFSSSPS